MKLLDSEIVYVDNHILVVDKPQGLLTQPTHLDEDSVEIRAKAWVKERYNKPGAVFLHPVHRLDKPVGGLVVCARTSKALSRLNASIREKEWKKVYRARHEGEMPMKEGVLAGYLRHGSFRAECSSEGDPEAKWAQLSYRVVGKGLVEIELDTGRYHQIRAQMAYVGCPIVGDVKYGSRFPRERSAIELYHVQLSFRHPVTREEMTLKSHFF